MHEQHAKKKEKDISCPQCCDWSSFKLKFAGKTKYLSSIDVEVARDTRRNYKLKQSSSMPSGMNT